MLKSKVSRTVINAYRVAHYRVGLPDEGFIFKIKKRSDELTGLMAEKGAASAAFLTAFNPGSRPAKEAANFRAQKKLERDLKGAGLAYLAGTGEDPSGRWKREPSFLVLGISLETAKALGVKYGQNAVVWVGPHAVPELVLLR